MTLDLTDRRTLLLSWLATLHGPDLAITPSDEGPLPPVGVLVRTALAWHLAYALVSFSGALAVVHGDGVLSAAVSRSGAAGLVAAALVLWWGGVALSTVLWWGGVRRLRR